MSADMSGHRPKLRQPDKPVSSEQQAAEVLARALCDCAGPFEAGVQHEPYCASGHARHAIRALPDDRRKAVVDALNGGEEPRFYSADYEAVGAERERDALALQVEALRGLVRSGIDRALLGHPEALDEWIERADALLATPATAADVKARLLELVVEVDRIEQLSVNGCVWGCDGPLEPPCDVHRLVYAARPLLTDTEDWCNNPDHTHPPGECPDFIDH